MITTLAVLPLIAGGGGGTLLADINQLDPPVIPASFPQDITSAGGKAYFSAFGGDGREPWVTDGTPAGTLQLADVFTGFSSSTPQGFAALPSGDVVFAATSLELGREVWITDGTPAGTTLLADVNVGAQSSDPTTFTEYLGRMWFVANDGGHGRELWSTDGTTSGTQFEFSFAPGVAGIEAALGSALMTVSGGSLYIAARDANGMGWSLWTSNGTAAGTVPVKRITTSGDQPVSQMVDMNGTLVLRAPSNNFSEAVWSSDGTPAGTIEVTTGGSIFGFDNNLVAVGNETFFAYDDGTNGRELWKTDGTLAGTVMVIDLGVGGPLSSSSDPRPIANLGGQLVFSAINFTIGSGLWLSDGTEAGTQQIMGVPTGTIIHPQNAVVSAGKLVFAGTTPETGAELFVTDGTLAGTGLVADIAPGTLPSSPFGLVDIGGQVVFAANDGILGNEIWTSDGVLGASLLADISPVLNNQASDPEEITALGSRAFLSATDGINGRELWVTDGTTAGTSLAFDLNPGPSPSDPVGLTALGDKLFFFANDGVHGLEPFVTDGTLGGTQLLADIAPGIAGSNWNAVEALIFNDRLFFTAFGGDGDGIWSTDGTPEGTEELDIPGITLQAFFQSSFVEFDGSLFFTGFDLSTGFEIYKSDGTSAGTELMIDLNPGTQSGPSSGRLVELDGALYFDGSDGVSGVELWRTDGTAQGTELVEDLTPGSASTNLADLQRVGDHLVFTILNENFHRQPWSSDGTQPAVQIASLPSGITGSIFSDSERAFFWGPNATTPELWTTDGTLAGTELILNTTQAQGFFGSPAFGIAGTGPVSILAADDGKSGFEIFRSDGTAAGTSLVVDVEPGASSSRPRGFARLGNQILFVAEQPAVGRELHAIALSAVGDHVLAPFGNACAGSSGDAPSLTGNGSATVGAPLSIDLAGGAPSSPSFLLLGLGSIINPIGACELDVAAPVVSVVNTDANGAFSLGVTPGAALVGLELFIEVLVVDPGGEFLGMTSKTRGLEVIVAP